VHDIQVAAAPERLAVNPGTTATYEVTVTNNGNGIEKLSLEESALPVNWELAFVAEGTSLEEIFIEPTESKSFSVEVKVPSSELAGVYNIAGRLADDLGNKWDIPLITVVNQIYSIDITTTLSRQLGSPGKVVFFTILCRNPGNGPDTIALDTSGLPADWRADFVYDNELTDRVVLEAREQDKVSLLVTIPYTTTDTIMEFSVVGTSSVGLQDDVALVIDIEMSNLEITKVRYKPQTMKANKPVTIELQVKNTGKVDCENVSVRFYDGNVPAGAMTLERLPGDTNKTVVFTWIPTKAGTYKLRFVIDPDDQVMETDEEDNEKIDKVTVQSGTNILPGFEALFLMVALMVGAVVVVLRRRD
jgi:uncharacterized membrane protein